MRVKRPTTTPTTYLKLDAVSPNQQDEFDGDERLPRMVLENGRGEAALCVESASDAWVNDDGILTTVYTEEPLPGINHVYLWDAVGAVNAYNRNDSTAPPTPDSYASGSGLDREGISELDGISLTLTTSSTEHRDTATGLMTTTDSGEVEDRTTNVEHNQSAPQETAPVEDDAPLANPAPIEIPPPERVGGDTGRGQLSRAWLQRFQRLQAWFKEFRSSNSWGIDEIKMMLNMLRPYLNEIEELFGEDINGEEWSWLFGVWSEGQEIVKELEARIVRIEGGDQPSVDGEGRTQDPSHETLSTGGLPNDEEGSALTEFSQEGFEQHQRNYSIRTRATRGQYNTSLLGLRDMACAIDAPEETDNDTTSLWSVLGISRPVLAPRFVGMGGNIDFFILSGGALDIHFNLDLDDLKGSNTGVFSTGGVGGGYDVGIGPDWHAAWADPGPGVDWTGLGCEANVGLCSPKGPGVSGGVFTSANATGGGAGTIVGGKVGLGYGGPPIPNYNSQPTTYTFRIWSPAP